MQQICAQCVLITLSVRASAVMAVELPIDVYLLMGQSNMSGRGELAQLRPDERSADPRIWVYANDGQWRLAAEPVDDAHDQRDGVSADLAAGVGPGMSFARRMLESQSSRRIGLVPCAKGGSRINEWMPAESRDTLYGSCVARAREAAARGVLSGVLWYQGESDARTLDDAEQWAEGFVSIMRQLRQDLSHPLPVVLVGLGDRPDPALWPTPFPGWSHVQRSQAVAAERLDCVAHVSAQELPRNADTLHLSTSAQLELGRRLADSMHPLRKRCAARRE